MELLGDIEDLIQEAHVPRLRNSVMPRVRKRKAALIREGPKENGVCKVECDSIIPGTQKVYLKTWGCAHNSSDSEYMAGQLAAYGYNIVDDKCAADVWVLNSCTVKNPAEDHFRNEIKAGREAGKKVVVAGCVPQGAPRSEFLEGLSVVGVQQIDRVVEVVEETLKGNSVRLLGKKKVEGKKAGGASLLLPKVRRNPLIEIISINTGCLNQCSYCKTKHARGELGSYPIEEIVARAKQSFSEGVCEIWLTSEDTGAYGRDIGVTLPDLLWQLVEVIPKGCRLRLGMTNPPYILDHLEEIAKIMQDHRVYAFLHVPVQSGSDGVLGEMKREYTVAEFCRVVDTLRDRVPGITIATDIICGFPTETEGDFQETLNLCAKYKFPSLFINQFYPRPGTPAAKMQRIPTKEVKNRSRQLTDLFQSYRPYDHKLGETQEVLVTEEAHDHAHWVAHNKFYEQVLVPKEENLLGKIVEVEIIETGKHYMKGQLSQSRIPSSPALSIPLPQGEVSGIPPTTLCKTQAKEDLAKQERYIILSFVLLISALLVKLAWVCVNMLNKITMDQGGGDTQLDDDLGLLMNLDANAPTTEEQNSHSTNQLDEGEYESSRDDDDVEAGAAAVGNDEDGEEEEQRVEPIPQILRVNTVLSHLPPSSSLPRVTERTPLIRPASSFTGLCSTSWSARSGPSPYTAENKPKRRPFQYVGSSSSISSGGQQQTRVTEPSSEDAQLYNRYRYYSRLRADVHPSEQALVIPDHVVPPQLFLPYIPGHLPDADGKQASHITIIAIWNTMMGTSLMTMPWAFGQAGFLGGLIIMLGMALLALYTAKCLLTLQKTMGLEGAGQELGRVCKQLVGGGAMGRVLEGLTVTFSVLTLVGAQVVYWVLMSNFLFNTGEIIYDMAQGEIHNDSSNALLCPPNVTEQSKNLVEPDPVGFHHWWQQDLTVPLYLIVPFLFLLNLRDARIFTYFNSLGAISVLVMYLFVIFKAATWGININFTDPSNPFYDAFFKNTFMCLTGTLSLAYFIHNCVVTIMQGNRHQENNVRDLSIAYVLVALTYIPIGVLFYVTFPLPKYCIVDNFLDNFPPHDVLLAVVRGFLFFQILTVYPLLGFFIRNQLFTYFLGPGHTFYLPRVMFLNTLLITMSVLVAIFYPNIGFIIRWVGAISGLAYIFLLPCLTHMLALHTQGGLTYPVAILHTVIIILGIGNFVAQFFTE